MMDQQKRLVIAGIKPGTFSLWPFWPGLDGDDLY